MRLWIFGLSLLACLMPWRAPFAQTLTDNVLRDMLSAKMPAGLVQRMCYNPRSFVVEAQGQILSYGTDMKIAPAQIEVSIHAELARLRAQEMRWLLEADLDSDLAISAQERDVLVHAASALMQDRLKLLHSHADGDGNEIVSLAELHSYAAGQAEQSLTDEARGGMRALSAFDLSGDGWIALDEVAQAVDLLCGAT